ncbi:AraC family transcriptional regulator [Albibacterium sp.]|uniref:AraC family transcriptional regulator n=1 Tax=Albibacterium sp. TaxID=2952885 RepID=UPI002BED1EF2|nr:AraC family transcriptional regulator [Albibacterium sp.]HUH17713.1 AraC family transcriptional regulator [Albibacterium sp.]
MKLNQKIVREITPLTESDFFTLFSRKKTEFDFPLHFHEEYELNLILNAKGARRIIGDHVETIDDSELVFIGPNLYHAWFTHQCISEEIQEVTIQFNNEILNTQFLSKNQSSYLRKLFEDSKKGILFPLETITDMQNLILTLKDSHGFTSVLNFMQILHLLSLSPYKTLCNEGFHEASLNANSRRIKLVFDYMNKNFRNDISLQDISSLVNMHEVSLSRFIKKRTGKSFVDCLNEIRIGQVSRLIIDTTQSISEIAYSCGFNNISYFNRVFKKKKGCTPKEFRENFTGVRLYI